MKRKERNLCFFSQLLSIGLEKPIEIGAPVYHKSAKIQGKLQPVYHGPYTVKGRTNTGNYILENRKGVQVRQTYPLSRLKETTAPENDDTNKVEKILDHRQQHGHIEYFVKWENKPSEDCSWLREADFEDVELIENYWAEKCPFHKLKSDNFIVQYYLIYTTIDNNNSHLLFKALNTIEACEKNL